VACRIVLRRIGIQVNSRGTRPAGGLICSNHLSYLDILVFAATVPCVFVSKREVRRWLAFGFFARCGGTIFVDRQSHTSAGQATRQMAEVLREGVPILLFPEGTSTDGSRVERFHATLLEPAVHLAMEMTAAAIGYRVRGGQERDICWYGDAPFASHLLRTLAHSGLTAEVEFFPDSLVDSDRKAAALQLHQQVEAMRNRITRTEPA
jgi:1-acyl-sn-glycerol-3-phosphate acyltransferase